MGMWLAVLVKEQDGEIPEIFEGRHGSRTPALQPYQSFGWDSAHSFRLSSV